MIPKCERRVEIVSFKGELGALTRERCREGEARDWIKAEAAAGTGQTKGGRGEEPGR